MKSSIEITPTAVRQVLNHWHSTEMLGQHPLGTLNIVEQQRQKAGHASSLLGRGLALRGLLSDAIEQLKPNDDTPDMTEREWRSYLIITERYQAGRIPDWIMIELNIAQRTFYKELKAGLAHLAAYLQHLESETTATVSVEMSFPTSPDQPYLFSVPSLPPLPIIGRDDLLAQIMPWLTTQQARTVALQGIPGVGKTTVAIALAHHKAVRDTFTDGVMWVGLGPNPDLTAILHHIALKLGVPADLFAQEKSLESQATLIRQAVLDKQILFIIDDVWHLDYAFMLCLGGTKATHLITTRKADIALDFAGGQVCPIEELDEVDSQALLTELAPEVFNNDHIELTALRQMIGGLPLALIIVGNHLYKNAYRGQLSRLQNSVKRLQERDTRLNLGLSQSPLAPHTALPRDAQISLAAVISVSYDSLLDSEKNALQALALLPPKPNSLTHEAAIHISQSSSEIIDSLVDEGLLEPVGNNRYTLHQLIHDYIQLHQKAPFPTDSLITYFTGYCEQHEYDYLSLDVEATNLSAAFHLAIQTGAYESLWRGLFVYFNFLLDCGRGEEAKWWLEQTSTLPANLLTPVTQARFLGCQGHYAKHRNAFQQAIDYYEQCYHLADEQALFNVALTAKIELAATYLDGGDAKAALGLVEPILSLVNTSSNLHWQARARIKICEIYYHHGDFSQVLEQAQAAQEICKNVPDPFVQARIHDYLGIYYIELGQFGKGNTHHEIALAHYQAAGNKIGENHIRDNLGVTALNLGQWPQAIDLLTQALEGRKNIGDVRGQIQSLMNLALVYILQKDIKRGHHFLDQAWQLASDAKHPYRQADILTNRAWLYRVEGKFKDAIDCAEQTITLAQKLGQRATEGDAHYQKGCALLELGCFDKATQSLETALSIWHRQEQPQLIAETQAYLAKRYLKGNDIARARDCLEDVLAYVNLSSDGFEDSAEILYICHHVLNASDEKPLAARFQQKAEAFIKQQSQKIDDPAVRQYYINSYQPYKNI